MQKNPLTNDQLDEIFGNFDADDNKGIDFKEFKEMLRRLSEGEFDNAETSKNYVNPIMAPTIDVVK